MPWTCPFIAFDVILFTWSKCSTKMNMLIRNSTFRSLSMFIAIINNNITFYASVFKRFMIHVPISLRNINMGRKGYKAINHNLRIKTIFSTKLLKISSFSEKLNAIILIIYTWSFTFVAIPIFNINLNCFKQIPLCFNLVKGPSKQASR
jgi:hypothetical protein